MAYQEGLVRCNITAATQGGEIVVNTVWLREDGGVFAENGPTLQGLADKVRDTWTALITTGIDTSAPLAQYYANTTVWQRVNAYRVNQLGRATSQAEALFGPTVKGSNAQHLTPQAALCVTTHTNTPGRSGRGRMFLGGLSTTVMGGLGGVSAVPQQNISFAMAKWYIALRHTNNSDDTWRPVVVSPTTSDSHKIVAVSVGSYLDTMRSRRNKLVEQRIRTVVDAT